MLEEPRRNRDASILLVEDDESQSALIERSLKLAEFDVESCKTVKEALRMVEQKEYAVAVVDLNLGTESGLEFVRSLSEKGCKTRIILHSVETSFVFAKEGINLGVFAYVEKSANAEHLVDFCHRAAAAFFRLNLEAADEEIAFQLRLLDAVEQGIVATDLVGRIIYWNRYSSQFTGISQDAAIGHPVTDFIVMPRSESKLFLSQMKEGETWQVDCQISKRSQQSALTPIRMVATGIRDRRGVLNGIVLSYHDLTLILKKEASLSLRAKLLLANAELAQSAVETVDRDSFLRETLRKIHEVLGLSSGRVVLRNPVSRHLECIENICTNEIECATPIQMLELDETEVHSPANGFLIPLFENGELIGRIEGEFASTRVSGVEKRDFLQSVEALIAGVLLRNWVLAEKRRSDTLVSEQQDQLAHVQRTATLGHMAAALAHELNQPLGSISNFAGGLLCGMDRTNGQEDELTQTLKLIRDEAIRAGAIVGRLRKFISLDRFNLEKVSLNACIQDTLQILKHYLASEKVQVELSVDEAVPLIQADAIRIQQVLVNVIKNSAEAMHGLHPENRQIHIVTKFENGWVQIVLADSGPEITDIEFASLFQPYYTTKKNGLGMGLCISKSIVEQHHGMMIMSRDPNGGIRTTIRIPQT